MYCEPIQNDVKPLISIFIFNYYALYLRKCFDSIFEQNVLDNIEIIYSDDNTTDGSWDIAIEYAYQYKGIITLTRNKRSIGPKNNLSNCLYMSKGKYYVPLCYDQAFLSEYVKQCIQTMESDPFAEFAIVYRRVKNSDPLPDIKGSPLVSVLIFNYNYGCYLSQCFDSVIAQTYDNIEIIFSDNASTDNSWEIATEYSLRYPGKFTITRNRKNFGVEVNWLNCDLNNKGKYYISLCSDDALVPEYIEKCVNVLEAYPNVAFSMVHRTIIDQYGQQIKEPPFYNCSCIIPGAEQAAVYMMAAVNPSVSQIMYRKVRTNEKKPLGDNLVARWYSSRILDFNLCCENPIAYIKEPLLLHRLHLQNDSFNAAKNMMEVIGPYVLQHQFADTANVYKLKNVMERLPKSIEKLSQLCLRYCARALLGKDERNSLRYFYLAGALMPEITSEPIFIKLQEYWKADDSKKKEIIEFLNTTDNLTTRSVSYDPPQGSIPITYHKLFV
ncbi:MAG: glycosyltransferase [Ignavibacteria bacterium]